jgi:hypothetical protein
LNLKRYCDKLPLQRQGFQSIVCSISSTGLPLAISEFFGTYDLEKEGAMRAIPAVFAILILVLAWGSQGYSQIWNREVIDNAGDVGYNSRIAVTSDGTPYVLYIADGVVRLAWRIPSADGGGGWNSTFVGTNVYPDYRSIAMCIDADDDVHIAFASYGAWYDLYLLRYSVFDSETKDWQLPVENVPEQTPYPFFPDIAVIDSGEAITPIIVYVKDGPSDSLKCATRDPVSGAWSLSVIYDQHPVGHQVSIAVDSHLGLHVSFYEETGLDLMYAKKPAGSSVWSCSYVDIAADVGIHSSIIVDSEDRPHIVYYDRTSKDLKYAKLISE